MSVRLFYASVLGPIAHPIAKDRAPRLNTKFNMNFRHYRLSPHPALCLVAIGCIAAVTYGSFVPLNYVPLSFAETLDRAQEMPWLSISIERRADWVANGALFFPCAVLLSAALSLDRGSVGRAMAALLACTILSTLAIAIEFAQHWFPGRTISKNDIIMMT